MSSISDFKIVDEDIQAIQRDLSSIADAFSRDTSVSSDLRDAFGHWGLADEFSAFSESWRVNRDRIKSNLEELAAQMKNIKVDTDLVDRSISGDTSQDNSGGGDSVSTTDSSGASTSTTATQSSLPSAQTTASSTAAPSTQSTGTQSDSILPDSSTTDTSQEGTEAVDQSAQDDDTEVRLSDDGDFYASVTAGGAATAGGTATLLALYKLWQSSRAGTGGIAAASAETFADARTRLLAGLDELGADGSDVKVELVSDGSNPDRMTAILRGEDGSTSIVDLSASDDGSAGATASDTTAIDADASADGATDSLVDDVSEAPTELPDTAAEPEVTDSTDAAESNPAENSGAGASLSPDLPLDSTADSPLQADSQLTDPGGQSGNGSVADPGSGWTNLGTVDPDVVSTDPSSTLPTSNTSDADVATSVSTDSTVTTAGAGIGVASMAGMGAGLGSSSASGSATSGRSETLRKVSQSPSDDEQKQKEADR